MLENQKWIKTNKERTKMKKLIILLVVVFAAISCERQAQNQSQTQSLNMTQAGEVTRADDLCDEAMQIATLTERVAWLEKENADLQMRLDECLGKKTVTKTRTVSSPKPAATKPAPKAPIVKSSAPITQKVIVPERKAAPSAPIVAGVANLDYLRQGGEIIFCVRANRREDCYFPHYAMQQGVTFNRFADNQVKGYNWKVEPTEGYSGDYGVTTEGTFYVSDEIIRKSLASGGLQFDNIVEIKAPYTGWELRPMIKEGNCWIYRTRQQ